MDNMVQMVQFVNSQMDTTHISSTCCTYKSGVFNKLAKVLVSISQSELIIKESEVNLAIDQKNSLLIPPFQYNAIRQLNSFAVCTISLFKRYHYLSSFNSLYCLEILCYYLFVRVLKSH